MQTNVSTEFLEEFNSQVKTLDTLVLEMDSQYNYLLAELDKAQQSE